MLYRDIKEDVLNLCGQDDTGDFSTMVGAAINRAYRRVLARTDQDSERREFTLASVSGTSQYGMPLGVKSVLNIDDPTNQRRIYDISSREFDSLYPGNTNTGDPWKAYPLGTYGVQRQPASAAVVTLVSSSAADTGSNYKLRVDGFTSAGVQTTEEVTLTGTTPVNTTNSYNTLERIVKVTPRSGSGFNGNVTLTDASANTLSVIPVWYESPSYLWYEFYPIPDSVITYTVRAIMRKHDLVYDSDWPDIDEDFHDLLVWGACAEVMASAGKNEQGLQMEQKFSDRVDELLGYQGRIRRNKTRTFSNITTDPQIPRRPLIPNVDFQ